MNNLAKEINHIKRPSLMRSSICRTQVLLSWKRNINSWLRTSCKTARWTSWRSACRLMISLARVALIATASWISRPTATTILRERQIQMIRLMHRKCSLICCLMAVTTSNGIKTQTKINRKILRKWRPFWTLTIKINVTHLRRLTASCLMTLHLTRMIMKRIFSEATITQICKELTPRFGRIKNECANEFNSGCNIKCGLASKIKTSFLNGKQMNNRI